MMSSTRVHHLAPRRHAPTLGDPFCLGAGVRYDGSKLSFVLDIHGRRWRVSVPVEVAHLALDHAFAAEGIAEPASVGELPSCSGLLRRVRRSVKRFGKKAGRAIGKAGKAIAKGAGQIVQSKALAAIVAASAVVCPAVGGPALGALAAAKGAAAVANAAARGNKRAQREAATMAGNAARMATSKAPAARLLTSALRSVA